MDEFTIGGPDDLGRIRSTSFDRRDGGSEGSTIKAPADVTLEPAGRRPDWVQVKLTLDEKNVPKNNRRIWRLDATVRPREAARFLR